MNSNTIQKTAHLRLVKSPDEIAELETWEQRDAIDRHRDVKREAAASRNVHQFRIVRTANLRTGTLH